MIGLMDCNNFFVSCERLFRPDLRTKPVIVLSSSGGCVVARSQEVKDLGIAMGVPYFEIQEICKKNEVTLFSSNFALYRDISQRVMSALRSEFSVCEVYSIDEAFFEIQEAVTEVEMAHARARIIQKTGIPVSIGVAHTKTLAKVANALAKRRTVEQSGSDSSLPGVCILYDDLWDTTKEHLPCGSIWGIGRQTSILLSKMNIHTVADFLSQKRSFVRHFFGVAGERLYLELTGIVTSRINEVKHSQQQSYMSTRSFRKVIKDKRILISALTYHVAHLAQKLRTDCSVASRITVIAQASRFSDFSHRKGSVSSVLESSTHNTFSLIQETLRLFECIYDSEIPYKKVGIVLSAVTSDSLSTGSLFNNKSDREEKTAQLNSVMDELTLKYGTNSIRIGVTVGDHKWQGTTELMSKEYTTDWNEIPHIKAI